MLVDTLQQLDALNESISQATLELESKRRKSASAHVLGQANLGEHGGLSKLFENVTSPSAHSAPRVHALSALSEHVTSIELNADRIADVLRRPIPTSSSLVLDPKHHQFSVLILQDYTSLIPLLIRNPSILAESFPLFLSSVASCAEAISAVKAVADLSDPQRTADISESIESLSTLSREVKEALQMLENKQSVQIQPPPKRVSLYEMETL
ncbi:hypothetical protein HDU81_002653 [Chytriomyces hyalinus]|nr:hypothetical protein HDU81_002653 [Chytriomyces hyalinus]